MKRESKSVLIVTTCFAPEHAIGSIRLSKFAKYLIRQGHHVTVISPELAAGTRRDESLECVEFETLSRYVVPQSRWFKRLLVTRRNTILAHGSATSLVSGVPRRGLVRRAKSVLLKYIHFAYTLLRNYDWQRQAVRRARAEFSFGSFDVLLASYPSLGAMWAAQRLRSDGVAPRWIADFRDPINYLTGSTRVLYWLNKVIQNRILAQADQVLAVSEGVLGKLADDPPPNYVVLSNGFDQDDLVNNPRCFVRGRHDPILTLCYAGGLYGGQRDLTVVFRALASLIASGALVRSAVRFGYAGRDFPILQAQASVHGVADLLVDYGLLNREQSLSMQAAADLVVVATWNTDEDQGVIPGKLFECFLLRTPILGVVSGSRPNSEIKSVIESVAGGFVYETATASPEEEFGSLCAFLLRAADRQTSKGLTVMSYADAVEEYSYQRIVARLSTLL